MTLCAKGCGGEVFRMNRRKRKPLAHAVCPRRKRKRGTRKVRAPKEGRLTLARWKVRRAECFDRDMYICQGCKKPLAVGYEWFDAHHVVKRSDGGSDELSNLITVCRACHDKLHPEKRVRWTKNNQADANMLNMSVPA